MLKCLQTKQKYAHQRISHASLTTYDQLWSPEMLPGNLLPHPTYLVPTRSNLIPATHFQAGPGQTTVLLVL